MQRVQVYKNLHRNKWSIKCKKSGLVLGHADSVMLFDVKYVVQQAGRRKVIASGQKNVHAWLEGEIVNANCFESFKNRTAEYHGRYPAMDHDKVWLAEVYYNPFNCDKFEVRRNRNPIDRSRMARLEPNGSVTGGFVCE